MDTKWMQKRSKNTSNTLRGSNDMAVGFDRLSGSDDVKSYGCQTIMYRHNSRSHSDTVVLESL